jgi:plastocyanin
VRLLLSAVVAGLALAAGLAGASPPAAAPVSEAAGVLKGGTQAGALPAGMSARAGSLAQRRAAARRKCRKIRKAGRRRACLRRVARKFRPPSTPVSKVAAVIDVRDKYFSPDVVAMQSGDSLLWVWNDVNGDPHNITLLSGPRGVSPYDFETSSAPSRNYRFKRTFKVPGRYELACSLHHLMTMTVDVTK